MNRYLTDHAAERCQERYGFIPNHIECAALVEDCRTGRAPCYRKTVEGNVHIAKLRDRLVIFLLAPKDKAIVTFLPRDYFVAGQLLAHRQKKLHAKQRGKAAPNAIDRHERRMTNKRAIQESMEAGE